MNSPDHDCAAQVMYLLPSAEAADRFVEILPSVIAGKTGRHNYTEWDQVLIGEGAAHAAMNPYHMPENRDCRRSYAKDMCQRSLDILNRTVMVPTHPLHTDRGDRRHDPQHRGGGAGRARRHAARGGGSAQRPAGRRAEVRHEGGGSRAALSGGAPSAAPHHH